MRPPTPRLTRTVPLLPSPTLYLSAMLQVARHPTQARTLFVPHLPLYRDDRPSRIEQTTQQRRADLATGTEDQGLAHQLLLAGGNAARNQARPSPAAIHDDARMPSTASL